MCITLVTSNTWDELMHIINNGNDDLAWAIMNIDFIINFKYLHIIDVQKTIVQGKVVMCNE